MRLSGAGFYVKRNSWSHPRAAARVISVGGLTNAPCRFSRRIISPRVPRS
jgi:hypothetical protein